MKKTTLLAVLTASSLSLGAGWGATIIDWGGTEMTSSTQNLNLPTATDSGTTRTWQYSATNAISPTSANYIGTDFYGSLMTDRTGVTTGPVNFNQTQVVQNAAGDQIAIALNPGTDTGRIQGLVFFKKQDFANYSSSPVSFDSTSTAYINWGNYGGASGGVRAAVLNGSTWYLSQTVGSGFNGSMTVSNLATENFASWDPTGAPLNATPGTFSTAGSTFADIQGVGYYFDIARTGNIAQVWVSDVEFSAIPEPSTWALLAIAGTFLVIFRRRRIA